MPQYWKNHTVSHITIISVCTHLFNSFDFKQFKSSLFRKLKNKIQKKLLLTNRKYSLTPTLLSLSFVPNFSLGLEIFVDPYLIDSFDRICLVNKANIFFEFILILVSCVVVSLIFQSIFQSKVFLKLKLNLFTYVKSTFFLC